MKNVANKIWFVAPLFGAVSACGADKSSDSQSDNSSVPKQERRIPVATPEELNIPTSTDPDSPFASDVFRRGLEAWRRPHSNGACASCHSVDAADLAYFGYTDATILRRAMGQEANVEDAHAIVALIHYQRERFDFAALDPAEVRFLQPGGELPAGETVRERDLNAHQELRDRGLRLFQPEPITTAEEARAARQELLELDVRTVKIPIPVNRWTDDSFRGDHHHSIDDWIPEVPSHPLDGQTAAWYGLHNAYIEQPTPVNLWGILDESWAMTDSLGLGLPDGYRNESDVPESWGRWSHIFRQKYRAVQIAAHMMRTDDARFPEIHRVGDEELAEMDFHQHWDERDFVKRRLDTFWNIGATLRGGAKEEPYLPENIMAKTNDFKSDALSNHLSWFFVGFIYDPALQFSAAGNKDEYFIDGMARHSDDLTRHGDSEDTVQHTMQYQQALMWAHSCFGNDVRYDANATNDDLSKCRKQATMQSGVSDRIENDSSGYVESLARFKSNVFRMQVHAHIEHLEKYGTISGPEGLAERFTRGFTGLNEPHIGAYTEIESISAAYEKLQQLLAEAEDLPGLKELLSDEEIAAVAANNLYTPPMRDEPLPIQHPASAIMSDDPGPISATFQAKCAGCHGDDGRGHGPGGEHPNAYYPPLLGVSLSALISAVRAGVSNETIPMPWFTEEQISDEELEVIYQALDRMD